MDQKRILSLLHNSIHTNLTDTALFFSLSETDWFKLMKIAKQQSVLGLCLDGFDSLKVNEALPPRNILIKWIGNVMTLENVYEKQKISIKELSSFFSKHSLRMVLMKGYGVSKYYPVAKHRGCGDLDIYFCGKGKYADELIKDKGIEVKQNEEKHSVYNFKVGSINS